ncbi:MAG: type II toxin-antitoxin system RelE/ParE family toxin [Holophagae bacterium]|jgi:plasmid stabilization system protein ParE
MRSAIFWSQRARGDLLEIGDFIARDKPKAAEAWVRGILDAVERTALFPTSGRIVPEIDRSDIREIILENYRIVYLLSETSITVLTVFESHRLMDQTVTDPAGSL